ncbi:DHA2 family efflux MFS transporter permease subunit [Silvimonas sp. JCM 19000]
MAAALPRSAAGNHSPWLIAFVVSIASFMEVLDTTIANVALRHIAGGLGAGQDESTWIITSYLISNAIILPISGWLATLIGRKRFYMVCVAIFTGSSLMCALSTNLPMMLFFRVLQGIGGGGLAPTEQSIFADSFPPEKHAQAFALYGVTVVLAPAIGPYLGGWLTDAFSWHWIFLINVPVGLLSLTLIQLFVDEPAILKQDKDELLNSGIPLDWLGFVLTASTFGFLQVVLDRFQQQDGFASTSISLMFVVFVVSLLALIFWEWNHPRPAVDVKLFKLRSFSAANVVMFVIGFTLFSTTQLIPQMTQELMGYDAMTAGKTLALGGLATTLMMPVAGLVVGRVIQPKWLVLASLVVSGMAMIHVSHLDITASLSDIALSRAYQAVSLPFLFVSITAAGYIGVPEDRNSQASSILNLSRNLGGSVGVSFATTLLAWREQFHHARLAEHISPLSRLPQDVTASAAALAQQGQQLVQPQAQLMGYLDIFWLFGVACIALWPVALLLKNLPQGGAAHGH